MGNVLRLDLLSFFFFSPSNTDLNRSSTTTLDWCLFGFLKRGSVLRRAKRGSDMRGGKEEDGVPAPIVFQKQLVRSGTPGNVCYK
jgi:hypothetical protein